MDESWLLGGVTIFKKLAWRSIGRLSRISDQKGFEEYHQDFVFRVQRRIRTARGGRISYGQAQKAVNVFLKVYVDWAKLPDRQASARLGRLLHVPLDSVVMDRVRSEHWAAYERMVVPVYRRRSVGSDDLSLSVITPAMYRAWQEFFREVRPHRPIDLDVIWSLAPRL